MRELLAGLVPGLPEAAVRAIVARADGIPLYAVETVRMLAGRGPAGARGRRLPPDRRPDDLAVPETLTALIASRLDAPRPGTTGRSCPDAAVLGQSFTLAGLAAVSGIAEADARAAPAGARPPRAPHASRPTRAARSAASTPSSRR